MDNLHHFAALAAQLMRLVSLFSAGIVMWTHPRDQDPFERDDMFVIIALAMSEFGGPADVWTADMASVASLYGTLQMFERADSDTLPLSALQIGALDALVPRCWAPAGDVGRAWKNSLHRLALTATVLGEFTPSASSATPSFVPSSWIVWQRYEVVTEHDISESYKSLGVSEPSAESLASGSSREAVRRQAAWKRTPESSHVREIFRFLPSIASLEPSN